MLGGIKVGLNATIILWKFSIELLKSCFVDFVVEKIDYPFMIGPGICGNPKVDPAIDIEVGFVVVDIDFEIVEIDFFFFEIDLDLGSFEIDFGVVEIDFIFGIDFKVASYNYYFVVNIVTW